MAIIIDWDCDFDPLTYSCQPKYSFRRYLLFIMVHIKQFLKILHVQKKNKKSTFYLSVNVFSTKVLIGDTIFYVS